MTKLQALTAEFPMLAVFTECAEFTSSTTPEAAVEALSEQSFGFLRSRLTRLAAEKTKPKFVEAMYGAPTRIAADHQNDE